MASPRAGFLLTTEDGAIKAKPGHDPEPGAGATPRRSAIIVGAGLLTVLILVGAAAFIGRHGSSSTVRTTAGASTPSELASAEQFALPSTSGADLSLAQMRGSPIVVYFYEGAG